MHLFCPAGEDRWLCTLLLQQGWHVEYCAASDAFTQAPTGFEEFFKQRRRWMPSTMANILDLLVSWRATIQRNAYVTFSYIAYQVNIHVLLIYAFLQYFIFKWYMVILIRMGAFVHSTIIMYNDRSTVQRFTNFLKTVLVCMLWSSYKVNAIVLRLSAHGVIG